MTDTDLLARQQAEGHKALLILETEFNAKPRTAVLSIQGSQIRALAQFHTFFQTYPSAVILNAAILKLADWFHHGNNVVRMHIYKVLDGVSKDHLTKIINVDETMRRILPVLGSNDPTARALTLRVFGCMAAVFKDSLDVQYGLLERVQKSTDRFETEAAVWASDQFCARSASFLSDMFISIQSRLTDPTTSFEVRLKLIKILRHMHSDIVMARQAKQLCLQLLTEKGDDERLVIVVLRTLTKLLSVALIDQREQIDRLLFFLLHDGRLLVQQSVLQDLQHLSHNDIMFDVSHITTLLSGIAASTVKSPRLQHSAYKCAETLIRSHRTLIDHILRQPSTSMERQTIMQTLGTCQTTLDNSIQQQQYILAIGCAQLLMAIAEISVSTMSKEEIDDPMMGASYDGEPLLYDSRPLLQHVSTQLSQIPINSLYNGDLGSCRKIKKLLTIKSRLLLLLNDQDGKDAFIEGYTMMIDHPQKEVGSILLQYCSTIATICKDLSSWFPRLALESLEKQIHSPVAFINILRLIFRTVQNDKTIGDDIIQLLRLFGKWDDTTTKYRSNGWHIYVIGKEAGVCGWYFVMHSLMSDLQSMTESDACLYWLSTLSLLGLAEWSVTQQDDTPMESIPTLNPLDLHVAALTKLKAFNAITGRSRFQTWFVRLRMEMIHAIQHMLATMEAVRRDDLEDCRIFKMMNNCASNFRVLASRYDIAAQSMDDDDNMLIVVMEDFKVSALILEHASRTCVKSSQGDSFFYIDPTLLSLLSKKANASTNTNVAFASSKLDDFRSMCLAFLQDMIKWEEEEQCQDMIEQRYMDATGIFCQSLLRCPLILPPSFFKLV